MRPSSRPVSAGSPRRRGEGGPGHRVVLGAAVALGLMAMLAVQRETRPQREVQGRVDPEVLSDLAASRHTRGDLVAAEPLYREALAARERVLGSDDPTVADACSDLGRLLKDSGQYDEAELWYTRAWQIRRERLEAGHPDLAASAHDLGRVLQARGDFARALELYDQALTLWKPREGEEDWWGAWVLSNRGLCLMHLGRMEEAGDALRQAHDRLVRALGPTHPRVATSFARRADWLERSGRPEEADRMREGLRSSSR